METKRRRVHVVVAALGAAWLLLCGLPPALFLADADANAYRILTQAEHFAGPAVGIAGDTPEEITAFRQLAGHRFASTIFRSLLLRASMPGKLYALAGLRRTSPRFYAVVAHPFRVWPGSVDTFFGCVIAAEPVSKIVSDHPNAVQLRPDETLDSWWRLHERERADWTVDISGGGYPSMFLDPTEPPGPTV